MLRRLSDRFGVFVFAALLLLCANFAHAQAVRWDLGAPGSAGAVLNAGTGSSPLFAQPNIALQFCNHPANAAPCTNLATTYTSITGGVACPTNQQVVLQGSNTCQSTSDNFGNIGAWVLPNTTCGGNLCYDYTLTVNGTVYGPYVWAPPSGGSGGGFNPPAAAVFPGSIAAPGPLMIGPPATGGIAAILFNNNDAFCLANANGWDQLADCGDPATSNSVLAWQPGTDRNERLFSTVFQSVPYVDGQFPCFNGTGFNASYFAMCPPSATVNSQTGVATFPSEKLNSGYDASASIQPNAYPGTNACQQIKNAIATWINTGWDGNLDGSQLANYWGSNELYCAAADATTMFFGGQPVYSPTPVVLHQGSFYFVIDGPTNGTNYTDGVPGNPSGEGTPGILVPSQFHWEGSTYNLSGATVCTGPGTPIPQCTHAFPQRSLGTIASITQTGTTATVTMSGTVTAITCSSGCTGNLATNERIQIVNSSCAADDVTRVVQSITNGSAGSGSFTINMEAGTAACSSNAGTVYAGTAIIGLAPGCGSPCTGQNPYIPGNQNGTGVQGFNQIIEHISLDLQGNQADASLFTGYGVIGIQNDNAGDLGYLNDIELHFNTFIAYDFGPGSTDYAYSHIRTTNFSAVSIPSAISMYHAAADWGVDHFGFIAGPTIVNTSGTAVTWNTSGAKFTAALAGTYVTIGTTAYLVNTVNSATSLTLNSSAGTQTAVPMNQEWTSIEYDGIKSAFVGTSELSHGHAEGSYDDIEKVVNAACRGCKVNTFLGSPTGAHASTNVIHDMADGGICEGCEDDNITRQSGGATVTELDDTNLINGASLACTDFSLAFYKTDIAGLPVHSCSNGTLGVGTQVTGSAVATSGALQDLDGNFGSAISFQSKYCETSGAPTSVNTGGATTTTGLSCLPAGSVIDAVVYRITTSITTAASFTVGDGTTANRFCTTQSTLTSGTTGICANQWISGTAGTMGQVGAHALVTTFNTTPGAGAIRFIVYYHTWTAPQS